MKFMSEKWIKEYELLANRIFSPGHTPTTVSTTILECFSNVKAYGGKYVWIEYELEDGLIVDFKHGIGLETLPRDADFRIMIDSQIIKKMIKKEVTEDNLITSGAFEMQGSLVLIEPSMRTIMIMQILKIIMFTSVFKGIGMSILNKKCHSYRKEIIEFGGVLK